MTLSYRSLASTLLLAAVTMSVAFQLYRASLGTPHAVDRFTLVAGAAYAFAFALAVGIRRDRRWIWYVTAALTTANLVYGVTSYYPMIHAARPFGLLDWLEGTLYTGLLLAVLGCSVLRLSQTTLKPASPAASRAVPHLAPLPAGDPS